jgi:hypothetical protein
MHRFKNINFLLKQFKSTEISQKPHGVRAGITAPATGLGVGVVPALFLCVSSLSSEPPQMS